MLNPKLRCPNATHSLLLVLVLAALNLKQLGAADVATVAVDSKSVVKYLLGCRKANGAFGPLHQSYTDAAWNYPAIQALQMLSHKIEGPAAILKHGLGQPTGHVGYGHWQFFHQHMIRSLLKSPMRPKHKRVKLTHQGFTIRYYGSPFGTDGDTFFKSVSGSDPDPRDINATELGYYNLSSLYYLLHGLQASGRSVSNADELNTYIRNRQAPNGGFVDVRTPDGKPTNRETHVAHTFHSLACLQQLQAPVPRAQDCADFVRACQDVTGGYRWNPGSVRQDQARGNYVDVYYTWAAMQALKILKAKLLRPAVTVGWINSLHNAHGGFGDQPGWRSRLYSTYYAVSSLALLSVTGQPVIAAKSLKAPPVVAISDDNRIYQGLFKTPVINESDLKGLRARALDFLALKSNDLELATQLQLAARALAPPMEVVLCPEAYPHRALRFGGALLHHVGNATLDPSHPKTSSVWSAADQAGARGNDWALYQQGVIRAVQESSLETSPRKKTRPRLNLFYPEQDFEMEYAYSAYDDGVHQQHGYNAVLAGFNWSPRDFVRVFPWRERYVDKLAPIADCDAHGDLQKWSPQLDHTRHLFISKSPSMSSFLDAAAAARVVCVILNSLGDDSSGVDSRATYYGHPAAVAFVKQRQKQWQWWK